jgi:hypothetical protein
MSQAGEADFDEEQREVTRMSHNITMEGAR